MGLFHGGDEMGNIHDVQQFVRSASGVKSLDALHSLMAATIGEFGFQYYALGHHVNVLRANLVQIGNYPDAWMDTVRNRDYIPHDPVLLACQTSAVGFRWSEVDQLIEHSQRQKEILSGARHAGMGDGYTVPIHIPGECAGSCSFAQRFGKSLNESTFPAAHYIGCFAFEAARRLVRQPGDRKRELAAGESLTPRQLDCVLLVARGKSDWEAARLLGLSQDTVHQHVETAKRKYGVATRTQLVIRALFDNQLGFRDVIMR